VSDHLRVNPILCDAYGHCAELLPELIQLDEWGYPIIDDGPIPQDLVRDTRRAVSSCPRLALFIERRAEAGTATAGSRHRPVRATRTGRS
jgi:ferredoxin